VTSWPRTLDLRVEPDADLAHVVRHLLGGGVIAYPTETRALSEAAGAVLRQSIRADRDQPPFDRVTMDGIAIRHAAWSAGRRAFAVAGVQRAGDPANRLDDPDACYEVMTGAFMPEGAYCFVRYEDIDVSN